MTKTKRSIRPTKKTTARATKVRQKRRTYHAQLGRPIQQTTS
jgi:hypothetical protein